MIRFLMFTGLWCLTYSVSAEVIDSLRPSYPSVPAVYETLNAGQLVSDARVDFGSSYVVGSTDGYQITDPFGNKFVVDDIEQPKCAFYGTYIVGGDELGQGGGSLEVVSNVYVEQVNFEHCQ